uniref:DNA-directed RNA polymerase n=1 Tax=Pithovirus LCPAC202 TaxID=2506592 RepID=A0A481Z7C0_9VIRU|nr:MAG: DNA-directed RNA polymerase subunit beta [Pithovirus LCPAC202]
MTSNHESFNPTNGRDNELYITTPSPIKDEIELGKLIMDESDSENVREITGSNIERPPSDDSTTDVTIVKENDTTEEEEVVLFDLSSKLSGIKSLDEIGMIGMGSIPEGMDVGADGQLLLSYLSTRGTVGDQIKAYENFIKRQIPIIIGQNVISLGEGKHGAFTNAHYTNPYLPGFTGGPKVLFPNVARQRGLTYAIDLKVDIECRRDKTGEVVMVDNTPQVIRGVYVGSIPVMLGSCFDNLQTHKILKDDLLKLGECPHDPRGYFIVSGTERVVMIQERLRANRILMYDRKKNIGKICRMTCLTTRGSTIVKLFTKGKDRGIRLNLQIFKGDRSDISIIQAFQILGIPKVQDVIDYILKFVKAEWRKKVVMALQGSVIAAYEIDDPFLDAYKMSIYTRPTIKGKRGRKKKVSQLLTDKNKIINEVYSELVKALFTQIDIRQAINKKEQDRMIKSKTILLAVMTARYAEFIACLRKPTDRDCWINKRLITAGRLMEQLFRRLWDGMINDVENCLVGQGKRTLEAIKQKIKPATITDSMESSFIPNKWGPINMTKDKNVVDALDREESILSVFDQLLRINTPTNRKSNQTSARSVRPDQLGYIDVVATPSGPTCGLVKNKSIGCWISVQGTNIPTWKYLSDGISKESTPETPNLCILNGMPLGWCNGKELRKQMIIRRRSMDISFDTALVCEDEMFNVYTDGSRPTRPFLIVGEDGIPLIESRNYIGRNFHELIIGGIVEYLDVWEAIRHGVIACSLEKLNTEREVKARHLILKKKIPVLMKTITDQLEEIEKSNLSREEIISNPAWLKLTKRKEELDKTWEKSERNYRRLINKSPYTHVEIDPNIALGVAASVIPFIGCNPGPRNNFQTNMGRQSLGITTSNPDCRYPTTGKSLAYPAPALVSTQMQEIFGLDKLPAGMNVILGIRTHPNNEEDAIVIKKEALERGLFTYTVVHSYSTVVYNPIKISNGEIIEYLVKPEEPFPHHNIQQYENLDQNGIVRLNSVVKSGDCLICKVKKITTHPKGSSSYFTSTTKKEDNSIYLEAWEDGIVDSVLASTNSTNEKIIKIRIRVTGRPIIGDKVSLRSAQKSVIGKIVPASEMPFTAEGITPDILINPHSLPKRMTISTYLEIITGKCAALSGTKINATAFKGFSIKTYSELLEILYNFDGSGTETLYNYSGDLLTKTKIMIGPSQYQLLKHQVLSKQQCRGQGPRTLNNRQPTKGRKRGGAIRLGEQERDGLIAHGAPHFLLDRTSTVCDSHYDIVCMNCRTTAISNVSRGILMCGSCNGNNFAIFRHPFTLTVLSYYAAATGVNITPFLKIENESSDEIIIEEDDDYFSEDISIGYDSDESDD